MEKIILGIDLGTTYSEAAYVDENGRPVVIRTPDGKTMVPSVVQITDDGIVVGELALNRWLVDEPHVVRWVKRSMGDDNYFFPRKRLFELESGVAADLTEGTIPDPVKEQFQKNGTSLSQDASVSPRGTSRWVITSGSSQYALVDELDRIVAYESFLTAPQISAEILKVIKEYAEQQVGPVHEAVISCPAYFNTNEIENTKRAGELAGFTVKEIVKEPVAAAIYFGVEHMKEGEQVMVCDLGGGTYDATILKLRKDGVFDPIATMGERHLGGHDWTTELVKVVADQCCQQFGEDPSNDLDTRQRLYEDCERTKRSFKDVDQASIPCMVGGQVQSVTVTRDRFEDQTEYLITVVVARCEECLAKAGLQWKHIDRVLMVGGSSRLARVAQALERASGKKPHMTETPDLMVAYGAAIMARGEVMVRVSPGTDSKKQGRGGLAPKPVKFLRKLARSCGVQAYDRDLGRITNTLIIPHGTEAPASKSLDEFEISGDNQEYFDLPIVEFENDDDFEPIKSYRFVCLPNARRGDQIKVTIHYDISGIYSAQAYDMQSGQELSGTLIEYQKPSLTETQGVQPWWFVFALDVSGSMDTNNKLKNAKQAVIDNAYDLIKAGGDSFKVGVVSFSNTADVVCRPTSDIAVIRRGVESLHVIGSTAMDEGIRKSMELLRDAPDGVGRQIVLVTDGMPDGDRVQSTSAAAADVWNQKMELSVVGIGHEDVNEAYLKSLTPKILVVPDSEPLGKVIGILTRKTPRSN